MKSIYLALVALALAATGAAAAQWQGREVTVDGARVVKNPEQAVEKLTIEMDELWRRGQEDDDVFFGMPVQVVEDDAGNVYVLDSQVSEILVFSPGGEYLRSIGREGEGPGEFRNGNDMYLRSDGVLGVVVIFPGKIVQLKRNGDPAENFPLPQDEGGGFQLVYKARAAGDRVVLAGARQSSGGGGQQQEQEIYLKAFDYKGNEVAHYHSMTEKTQYGGMKFDEKVFANFKGQWSAAADGRAAGALAFDDYRIHVWNADGSLAYIIERPDYPPLERTAAEKERFQKLYEGVTRWNPNSSFETSATHRAVVQLQFRPDGSLWVLPGHGVWSTADGTMATFDVYDRDGRFVRQVEMKGPGNAAEDGVFFAGKRLFRVTDQLSAFMASLGGDTEVDENAEPLQVIAYDIDLPTLGVKH